MSADDNATPVRRAPSSKARFREYVRKYRRGEDHAGKEAPGGDRLAKLDALADEDPNSKRRTRRSRSFALLVREFWALLRGNRWTVAFGVTTVALSVLIGLALPYSTKIAIDYILTDHPGPAGLPDWVPTRDRVELLWLLGAALMCLTLLSISIWITGRWRMTRLGRRLTAKVRRRVFEHAVRLPLHRVYAIKSGGAASILRDDAGQSAALIFSLLYNPVRAVVQLVGTLVILLTVDWRLLIGAALLLPAAWFSQKAWIGRIRPVYRDIRTTQQRIDAHTTESFGGMRVVRGFSRQRGETGRFTTSNHLVARQEVRAWWWSRGIEMVWQVLLPLGSVAVLIYGGSRVVQGSLTIGDVMMFSAYLLMLLGPLESLSASATGIQAELAAFDRVLDLLEEPTEFEPVPAATTTAAAGAGIIARVSKGLRRQRTGDVVDPADIAGAVEFRNVGFKYPAAEDWVLRDINLRVRPGMTVALVGPSGAGKTTLCNLVARFYDATEGAVLIDGRDLRTLDADSYRRCLGIVEQDVFLFDGSVRENIGYARRGASAADVRHAAEAANAHAFISRLDDGYDTLIGERGVRLSGGQKQRIAIARALLADPRILVLDEATSNLDSESEALIQTSLAGLMKGRTCFVIAHRLSTIRHADLIVVMENGRVVETGTHEELSSREGRYWDMLTLQLGPGVRVQKST
jgi:ATP-binding cassette, subfamily B, bacterial